MTRPAVLHPFGLFTFAPPCFYVKACWGQAQFFFSFLDFTAGILEPSGNLRLFDRFFRLQVPDESDHFDQAHIVEGCEFFHDDLFKTGHGVFLGFFHFFGLARRIPLNLGELKWMPKTQLPVL